jgi:hypothetical protein
MRLILSRHISPSSNVWFVAISIAQFFFVDDDFKLEMAKDYIEDHQDFELLGAYFSPVSSGSYIFFNGGLF